MIQKKNHRTLEKQRACPLDPRCRYLYGPMAHDRISDHCRGRQWPTGPPGYYKMEYEKYQVLDDLPEMTMDDLLSVTDEMMAYLRGNREDLHVFTTMGENTGSFFQCPGESPTWRMRGLFLAWAQMAGAYVYPGLCRPFIFLETGP